MSEEELKPPKALRSFRANWQQKNTQTRVLRDLVNYDYGGIRGKGGRSRTKGAKTE